MTHPIFAEATAMVVLSLLMLVGAVVLVLLMAGSGIFNFVERWRSW